MNQTLLALSALILGTAVISLPVHADNSMAGMDMGGKKAAQQTAATASAPKSLSVSATLNPAAPQTGENTLNLLVMDGTGKPVTGLKLTTSVAMTSMDMGTTHPAFTETGSGHYAAKVSFSMDGPWRVVVRNQGGKVAVLDFDAGSKTPWKPPQIKAAAPASPATSTPPASSSTPTAPAAMPGMDMSGGKTMDNKTDSTKSDNAKSDNAKADNAKADKSGSMAGMDMSGTASKPVDKANAGMGGMDMGDTKPMKMTGIGDMKTATIPELKETGTYTATGEENWKMQTGFGHNAPMVGMMNQMMVGGSGAEGMKMAPMDMKFGDANYTKPDASDVDDSMAGMDMGGKGKSADAGKSGDKSKSGDMAGMDMSSKSGNAAKPGDMTGMKMDDPKAGDMPASAPATIKAATASAPKAGDNSLTITVTDTQGKPVTGVAITATVAMTSMDMGTTHPAVTEKGAGQYVSTVNFSMAGPWRVKVKVTQSGQKPQIKVFDFDAK